jgi:hypothetical protein
MSTNFVGIKNESQEIRRCFWLPILNIISLIIVITIFRPYKNLSYNFFFQNCFSDKDECTDTNICGFKCHNTDGSYYCSCDAGYTLSTSDRRSCDGMCL